VGVDRLVEVIESELDRGGIGIAVAVVADDALAWSGAFGRLDVDRPQSVTTETVFGLQSVTKTIVATALMHWVERGVIGLDDPVNRHLAPLVIRNAWEERSPVTIRQLLTHTGGLPMSVGWSDDASLEEFVANTVSTDAEPGTRLIYANWGYNVLGYLVMRLAGAATWDAAVADLVLRPLGMASTVAEPATPAADDRNRATGHVVSRLDGTHLRLGPTEWPYHPGPPSGSLVGTVGDLSRFLLAHLNGGGPVLGPDAVADMQRLHAPLGTGGGGMGLGFRVDSRGCRPFFCHGGDGSGFTAFVCGHPEERVGAAVLMNVAEAQAARSTIARAALEFALGDGRAATAVHSTARAVRPALGGYKSTYWGVRADVTEAAGEPVVTVPASMITFAESASLLAEVGGRWRADGGMFDGFELDFEGTGGDRRFFGGVYAFEFVADDTTPVTLPIAVDETGDLGGRWSGAMDTPIGALPLELDVDAPAATVTIALLGVEARDTDADAANGWIRARFELDIIGFGPVEVFARLGRTEARLEGLIYVRHGSGEFVIPAVLEGAGAG
jgi:CubicO group peptidase (beta-lactamase class C family)